MRAARGVAALGRPLAAHRELVPQQGDLHVLGGG